MLFAALFNKKCSAYPSTASASANLKASLVYLNEHGGPLFVRYSLK